jgi:hypothetical protein
MINQSGYKGPSITHPGVYRIRVSGRLNPDWSERLQGMTVAVFQREGGTVYTELTGLLRDQAALMGVLEQLYNCGIPLLSVKCMSADQP